MTPTQSQSLQQRLSKADISFVYYVTLGLLENTPSSMTQIAKALDITTSGATTLVDYMEKKGLVSRQRNPDDQQDRRLVRVRITAEGQKVLGKINQS